MDPILQVILIAKIFISSYPLGWHDFTSYDGGLLFSYLITFIDHLLISPPRGLFSLTGIASFPAPSGIIIRPLRSNSTRVPTLSR